MGRSVIHSELNSYVWVSSREKPKFCNTESWVPAREWEDESHSFLNNGRQRSSTSSRLELQTDRRRPIYRIGTNWPSRRYLDIVSTKKEEDHEKYCGLDYIVDRCYGYVPFRCIFRRRVEENVGLFERLDCKNPNDLSKDQSHLFQLGCLIRRIPVMDACRQYAFNCPVGWMLVV